ncbi:hypothetical protein EW146_g8738 [Bondarzewia mesenterica]|uniref:Uncharacterized protein n=1 Tax=Bondarzewia mesenterica TaxID=1095465 RepID=A0A4S4LDM5_9AGAM|nr:hypothetical protein EW146_g8738 [Bondarzewia mesenterica]
MVSRAHRSSARSSFISAARYPSASEVLPRVEPERALGCDRTSISYIIPRDATHVALDAHSGQHRVVDFIAPSLCPPPAAHIPDSFEIMASSPPTIIHRTPSTRNTLDFNVDDAGGSGMPSQNHFVAVPISHVLQSDAASSTSNLSSIGTAVSDSQHPQFPDYPASPKLPFDAVEVTPIIPEWVDRYKRNINVTQKASDFNPIILPFRKDFSYPQSETDWSSCEHPEGVSTGAHISKKCDSQCWGYYLVDHNRRAIFWAHEFDPESLFEEVEVVASDTLLRHAFERWYWVHCSNFPRSSRFTGEVIKEAQRYLMSGIFDQILSSGSLAPYPIDTLNTMAQTLSEWNSLGEPDDALIFHVGRLLSFYAHRKFLHYHGEIGARLYPGQSIYGHEEEEKRHSPIFRLVSFVFFMKPASCLSSLNSVTMDNIVTLATWLPFIENEFSQWADVTRQSTQLLVGNFAFLAVPSVVDAISGSGDPLSAGSKASGSAFFTHWTVAQILSALSIFLVISSIASIFLLREFYSIKRRENVGQLANFFKSHRQSPGIFFKKLELIAILHRLPLACLAWGAIASIVSFAFWSLESQDPATRPLFSVAVLLMFSSAMLWLTFRVPNYINLCIEWIGGRTVRLRQLFKELPVIRGQNRLQSSLANADSRVEMGQVHSE